MDRLQEMCRALDPQNRGARDPYRKKIRPVEEAFLYGRFHHDSLTDAELEAKSQVLVIGQYSTGKTTFIRHLLGADYPNMNIGPEPTTDKFTLVLHGAEDGTVEGTSLSVIKELPYEGLKRFGPGFLSKLDASVSTCPLLENLTIVDTPGVLSGEMDQQQRAYDFADVARWFADRSDMILILFDAQRLDVSDEILKILKRLRGHQSVIRIVLNKADQVDRAELRRAHGALMWSLSKVFDNPEMVRVYLGSFWDRPLKYTAHRRLLESDQDALTKELADLPRLSAVRKMNQLIRRLNLVRAHACVLSYLSEQMPRLYGASRQRAELLDDLEGVLETVRARHDFHEADMPDADDLRTHLQSVDFSDLPTLTPSALRQLNDVVDVDIHKVLREGGGSESIFKFLAHRAPPRERGLFARAGSTAMGLFSRGDPASKSQHGSMSATLGAPHKASPSQGSRTLRSSSAARSGDDDASSAQQARSGAGGGSAQTTVGGRVRLGNEAERRKSNLAWSIVTQTLLALLLVVLALGLLALGLLLFAPDSTTLQDFMPQALVRELSMATSREDVEDDLESQPFRLAEALEGAFRGVVH